MRSIDYAAQKLGGESALEELAAAVDLPKQEFIRLMQRQAKPVSLQSPVWEDGTSLADLIEDKRAASPQQKALDKISLQEVRKALAWLPPRQEIILRRRFGIDDKRDYTLEEVGDMFAITRERVRQLEQKALRQLRHGNLVGKTCRPFSKRDESSAEAEIDSSTDAPGSTGHPHH